MSLRDALVTLTTYRPGERWAVWADSQNQVQMCRLDSHLGAGTWATPIGHMTEGEMAKRGWVKIPGPESAAERYRVALETVEAGRPAGSPESTLASDGSWREFARDLQRVARMALRP